MSESTKSRVSLSAPSLVQNHNTVSVLLLPFPTQAVPACRISELHPSTSTARTIREGLGADSPEQKLVVGYAV